MRGGNGKNSVKSKCFLPELARGVREALTLHGLGDVLDVSAFELLLGRGEARLVEEGDKLVAGPRGEGAEVKGRARGLAELVELRDLDDVSAKDFLALRANLGRGERSEGQKSKEKDGLHR